MQSYLGRLQKPGMVVLLLLLTAACSSPVQHVTARYWPGVTHDDDYPEKFDPEFMSRTGQSGKNLLGVAFSGGGTRSASATIGQLRALHMLGWDKSANYITAVSGGSWAAVPYTYLPHTVAGQPIDDACTLPRDMEKTSGLNHRCFLGEYRSPEELTSSLLEDRSNGMMAEAIPSGVVAPRFIWEAIKGRRDEIYSRTIGHFFLNNFGLNKRTQFFTWKEKDLVRILDENKDQKKLNGDNLDKEDFITVERKRPYLVVGGTLLAREKPLKDDVFHFEMTPLYVGAPSQAEIAVERLDPGTGEVQVLGQRIVGTDELEAYRAASERGPNGLIDDKRGNLVNTRLVGGGYVEPFAYDSTEPKFLENNRVKAKVGTRRHQFTLSDVVGTSGAAPQETLVVLGFQTLGFPEYDHWPIPNARAGVAEDEEKPDLEAYEYSHGDGGHLDNLGVMPLLARGVDKIIAFVNTPTRFRPYEDCADTGCTPPRKPVYGQVLVDDLVAMFRPIDAKPFNKVFTAGEQGLNDLYMDFAKDRELGQPLTSCRQYEVVENLLYNIKPRAGYKPTICWVYLERAGAWLDKVAHNKNISAETCRDLVLGRGPYLNFPHYKTFFQEKLRIIGLETEQVNALSDLTSWSVLASATEISSKLGLELKNTGIEKVDKYLTESKTDARGDVTDKTKRLSALYKACDLIERVS